MFCVLHCVPTTQSQTFLHHHIFDPLYPLLPLLPFLLVTTILLSMTSFLTNFPLQLARGRKQSTRTFGYSLICLCDCRKLHVSWSSHTSTPMQPHRHLYSLASSAWWSRIVLCLFFSWLHQQGRQGTL